MANSNTIQVTLEVRDDGSVVVKGFADKTKKSVGEMESATKKSSVSMTESLKQVRMQWLAIIGTLTIAAAFAKRAVSLYAAQESAQMDLAVAMKNQGDFTRANYRELLNYAAALQKVTTYGDETTIAVMANLKSYGMNTEELKRATEATMDLATAKKMDLKAASELVGKAFVGETGTLSRYGIIINDAAGKGEKFDKVLEQINGRFGGAAQAQIETYAGQWKQIANWWGDIAEKAGNALLKVLEALQFAVGLVGVGFYSMLEVIAGGLARLVSYAEKLPVIGKYFAGLRQELDFIAQGYARAKEEVLEFTNKNYEMLIAFDRVEKAAEKMAGGGRKPAPVVAMTEEQLELQRKLFDAIKQLTLSETEYKIWALNQEVSEMRKVAGESKSLQGLISEYRRAALADMVKDFETAYAQIGQTEFDLARAAVEEQAQAFREAGADAIRVAEWVEAQLKSIQERENADKIKMQEDFARAYSELGLTPFELERKALAEQVEAWRQAEVDKTQLTEYESRRRAQINREEFHERLDTVRGLVGGVASLFEDLAEADARYSREAFYVYKAFKMAEVQISTASAVMKAFEGVADKSGIGLALAYMQAAMAGAFGIMQTALIANAQPPSYDEGGVSTRPGIYYSGVPEAHIPLKGGSVPVEIKGEEKREIRLEIANIVSPELLDAYIASPRGRRAMLNFIGQNAGTVRRVIRH